jgi:predicted permease
LDPLSLTLLTLGFPLGRTPLKRVAKPLSAFLVYVVAPVLGFWAGLGLKGEFISALAPLAEVPILLIAYKSFESCPKRGGAAITSAFGNTIFLGIPAVLAVGGSLDSAVTYSMVTTFIHYTSASLISCKKGKVQFQPFTVTFILGVMLSPYSQALSSYAWTKYLAAELSKLGLLILGLSFKFEYLKLDKEVIKIGFFKHLALPTLTLPFVLLGGGKAVLVESTMPPAFMNIALAYVYGFDVSLVTKTVITLTLVWLIFFVPISFFVH